MLDAPLDDLLAAARGRRRGDGLVTYSPKVFVPLTTLCRDVCGYCTFARPPRRGERAYLSEDEVLAIAHHERLPEIAAAELGNYLVRTPGGEMRIKSIIRDDIGEACACGDRQRELALKLMLRNFVLQHPNCEERHRERL